MPPDRRETAARVVRPGGRLVVCEFSTPTNGAFRALYEKVALEAIQVVAKGSSNPEAYTYLAESIRAWPDQRGLAARITDAGWEVWYYPKVTVLHIKEAASRSSYKARVEFYRAMNIFYDKHYKATTPFWLDWLIRGGVAIFGWADLTMRRMRGQYGRTVP